MIPAAAGKTELDHLVEAAATLAQGVAWHEATPGITPATGATWRATLATPLGDVTLES